MKNLYYFKIVKVYDASSDEGKAIEIDLAQFSDLRHAQIFINALETANLEQDALLHITYRIDGIHTDL